MRTKFLILLLLEAGSVGIGVLKKNFSISSHFVPAFLPCDAQIKTMP